MLQNWQSNFALLHDFTKSHPEIKIEPSSICIPENARPEFYRLFDAVRRAFVIDTAPGLVARAEDVSSACKAVESNLKKSLELENITFPNPLGWFLQNPVEGVMRVIFDPLFDLLKGKVSDIEFTKKLTETVKDTLTELYQQGYDKWVGLVLAYALEPDQLFRVGVRRPAEHREWTIIRSNKGQEAVPFPEHTNAISFARFPENLFVVPDLIIHSSSFDRYFAFRGGINTAIASAINASEEREWRIYDKPVTNESNPLFIYVDNNPDNINLVADACRICKPDLIVQTIGLTTASKARGLEQAAYWQEFLSPSMGTFVVGEKAEEIEGELPSGICAFETRLDNSAFLPIIETLKKQSSPE